MPGRSCVRHRPAWRSWSSARPQWDALEKQAALRQWREAQEDLSARQQQLTALEQLSGDLPDRDALARMQAQLDLLDRSRDTLTQARRTAQQRQSEAQTAQDAWAAHPLYPAEETQLRQQAEAMTPPTMPGPVLPISAAVLLCAAAAAFALLAAPARFIAAVCGAAAAAGLFLYYVVSRRRIAAPSADGPGPSGQRWSGRPPPIWSCEPPHGRRRSSPVRPPPPPTVWPCSSSSSW